MQNLRDMFHLQVDSVPVFLFNTRPTLRGQIAQLVEQRIENPRVGGSIPSLATILRRFIFPVSLLSHTRNLEWQLSEKENGLKYAVANTALYRNLFI